MSQGGALEAKERVRSATDIVELIGGYISLRRQGANFVGLCPWHDDSRPSLQVNPQRQTYKCWVCDLGGDVFSFLMKQEGLSFREALERLAERAGIDLGHAGPGSSSPDPKRVLFETLAWAERIYHECLVSSPEAEPARRYLAQRGLSGESLGGFRLGFAPDRWDWLLSRARGTTFSPALLEAVGLAAPRANGPGHYDRFRGRVLFPIRDTSGRPIAFGGRILPELAEQHPAKYINSPETPLFVKNRTLYGQDRAAAAIRASSEAIIVEGYTDCVMAHQMGIPQTVAVLGTALGERHVRLLRGMAERVVLVLDGDEAGVRRANEVLELFIREQVDLRVLTLPEGLDPCDFLLARGADEFRRLSAAAPDAIEHVLATWIPREAARNAHVRQQTLEKVLAKLAGLASLSELADTATQIKEQHLLTSLALRLGVDVPAVKERFSAVRKQTARRRRPAAAALAASPSEPGDEAPALTAWEQELLGLVIRDVQCARQVAEQLDPHSLPSEAAQQILLACRELLGLGQEPGLGKLLSACDDPRIKSLLVAIDERSAVHSAADPLAHLSQLFSALDAQRTKEEVAAATSALRGSEIDDDEKLLHLERLLDLERHRHGIASPKEG